MRLIKFTIFSLLISIILISFLFFYILWKYSAEIPSYDKILNYKPNLSSRVYSSDGLLLKSYYIEERIYIPINRIPTEIKEAFISAEDKNFYSHFGIDLFAITRAMFTNLLSMNKKRVVGASTITQQVVKNILLTSEVTYERKIKEILLAIRIERILSKDKILELYLNDIYLGFGSYGIGTASLNYFNKSINELDIHEIAFLAALPKAPNNYNPNTKYENALERRNWVIDRMFKNGFLKKHNLKTKNKPIIIFERTQNLFTKADYYYEEIRKELYNKFGKRALYSEGLIIKTSIDSKLQNIADNSLKEGLINYDKSQGWNGVIDNLKQNTFFKKREYYYKINPFTESWFPVIVIKKEKKSILHTKSLDNINYRIDLDIKINSWLKKEDFKVGDVFFIEVINEQNIIMQIPKVNGAIIVMNPHNGQVLALSGGFSFKLSEFNRATQAKRQPGSAFKPFVYITALKNGYTPSTLILDAPYVVDQGPGLPKWKPANYTEEFYGLSTMRTGIEKSRNLMTVRLANKIGMKKVLDTAKSFGFKDGIDEKLSMALGSGIVTLVQLTNAYGIIANGGNKIEPQIITSIYSKEGKKILGNNSKICKECRVNIINDNIKLPKLILNQEKAIDPKVAYQITSMMEGVIKRGTAKKLKNLEIPLAGKTGTTNDNKDAWFIGYSPNLVVGVYVGYDTPKSLGYKQTASSVAVPIFKNFAQKTKINKNKLPFRVPSGISFVKIDSKTGLTSNNKDSILEPFILGSEPYNDKVNIIDGLNNMQIDSISGTGALLN